MIPEVKSFLFQISQLFTKIRENCGKYLHRDKHCELRSLEIGDAIRTLIKKTCGGF